MKESNDRSQNLAIIAPPNEERMKELLDWLEYVRDHFQGYVGILAHEDHFDDCYKQVRTLVEDYPKLYSKIER